MLPQSALDHYAAQQALTASAVLLVRREWARMGPDFDASWQSIAVRVQLILASAQLGAARDGAAYVPEVLAEQGHTVKPLALVNPRAFAGVASDGRDLAGLLVRSVVTAKSGIGRGLSVPDALASGGGWLESAVRTQVADAARDACLAGITASPGAGWARLAPPPVCKRCAVLAGEWFRHNEGFARHPRCDCRHVPALVLDASTAGYGVEVDDVKDLTRRERAAIAGGADFNKTINASRKYRYLPPTRVDALAASPSRATAVEALTKAGYLAA